MSVEVKGLGAFDAAVKSWFAAVEEAAVEAAVGLAHEAFEQILETGPQFSGDFVATIHKWLPFSYAVDAFRGTISGNGNILEVTIVLLSIAIIFTLLTIMMFNIRAKMIKNNKKGLYDFIEKCGLA